MKNDRFKAAVVRAGVIAAVLSAALAAGIPMIPLGFANGIIPLGVIGIVLTVVGFYGSPLMWVRFADLRACGGVYGLITEDGLRSVSAIAGTLGQPVEKVRKTLTQLTSRRYLTGYVYDGGDTLSESGDGGRLKCPDCGAPLTPDGDGYRCQYCGGRFHDLPRK